MQKNSRKSFDSVGHFSKIHYILHLKFYFRTYYEFQIYYEFQMFNRIQIHTVFKYKLFSLKIVLISSSNSIPIFLVCSPLPPSPLFNFLFLTLHQKFEKKSYIPNHHQQHSSLDLRRYQNSNLKNY